MAKNEYALDELKSLWKEPWTLLLTTDGAELFGAVSRNYIVLRLGQDIIGPLCYSGFDELIDEQTMCRRIEEETGLCLEPEDWRILVNSMVAALWAIDVQYSERFGLT